MALVTIERRSRQTITAPNGAKFIRQVVAVEHLTSPQPRLRRRLATAAEIAESQHLGTNCWGIPASVNAFFEKQRR